ncbi:MAG: CobN component of cobalt chelatase involved in biosynthesis [Myxococcaceae bacterium]|nr:CobN component of cobalt chelatase involved in biosynthesis [Myxococcaceae bacterium]
MRNRAVSLVGLFLTMVQLACGADTTPRDGAESAPQETSPEPSQDLTGATIGGDSAGKGSAPRRTQPSLGEIDLNAGGSAGGSGAGSSGGAGSGGAGTSSGGPGTSSSGGIVDPNAGAGPKPTTTCTVSKDSAGFFTRSTSQSSYVAYVPASYNGTAPVRLIVGLHGCGDDAKNFATWGVNPYDTRATQTHIGISIGGQDGNCWNTSGGDDAKIFAAIDDISKCFWVHQKKVAIAGFSSGGQLAYRVGLKNASRFAAILIEDSGLYAADSNPDGLLASASWKVNIAHLTHASDPVFPLAKVKADWAKTTAAGFPLITKETAGQHDGQSSDWATWLIPQSASWTAP